MKKLLWISVMALAIAASFTACDDSGSSASNSVPEYKAKADLPDTCELEVAKVDTSYYACLEDKWIEVKDSVVIEKIKKGLDEEELEEELKKLLRKKSSSSKKPESSSSVAEDEEDEESSSSSEEAEEEKPSDSSKKKDKGKGSSEGSSGSGEGGSGSGSGSGEGGSGVLKRNVNFSVLDEYVNWDENGTKATMKADVTAEDFLKKLEEADYYNYEPTNIAPNNDMLQAIGSALEFESGNLLSGKAVYTEEDSSEYYILVTDLKKGKSIYTDIIPFGKCGLTHYSKNTLFCGSDGSVHYKCGGKTYDTETQYCKDKTTVEDLLKCGEVVYNPEDRFCYADEYVFDKCGTKPYNVLKEYCEGSSVESYVITKSADVVEIGETLIVEINKVFSATISLKTQDASYVGYTSTDNGTGGLKISVTNKEALSTGTKTVTLNIVMNNQGYVFVTPVELKVAPKTGTCGTKQYNTKTQFCDTRGSGTVYEKVTIGTQTWMAENLNYETASGSYCYGNIPSSCNTFGRLYTWNATDGVCPLGWRMPTKSDWQDLMDKSGYGINTTSYRKDGSNQTGFSSVDAGHRNLDGTYDSYTRYWSSTKAKTSGTDDYYYYLHLGKEKDMGVGSGNGLPGFAYPVRCIKN